MKAKKWIALLLAACMLLGMFCACGDAKSSVEAASEAASEPAAADYTAVPWSDYDALIQKIYTTTDLSARVDLMHEAEDILMDTGCLVPLYYYVRTYMQSEDISGIVSLSTGMMYWRFATKASGDTKTYNACIGSEPDYLDPQLSSSVDGGILACNTFEGLMTVDEAGNIVPGQAESYTETQNDDGTVTYAFTMRDGLKWSNGKPLDASDFEYSWKRAAAPETASDYNYLYDVVARTADGELDCAASEDGKTFTVTLTAPCPYFLNLCAFPTFFPIYQETVEAANPGGDVPGAWALEPGDNFVCNGPWILDTWEHESSMTYVKNKEYRDAKNVSFETINYMLTSDDAVALAAYDTGDLDMTDKIPVTEMATVKTRSDYHCDPYLGTYYVEFNIKSDAYEGLGLTTDAECVTFRKAINLLIDRDYIVEEVTQAGQIPANTFIPDGCADGNGGKFRSNTGAYTYPVADETGYFSLKDYDANVQEGIAMLESIGFKFENGVLSEETPIDFDFLVNTSTGNIAIGEAIQADLASVGINMNIVQEEWNVFLEDRKSGNYDVARAGWIMDYDDPVNMLEMFVSTSGNNDPQFGK